MYDLFELVVRKMCCGESVVFGWFGVFLILVMWFWDVSELLGVGV